MQRLRKEEGFGLLELTISLVMLAVGIMALVAAFSSGMLALGRASRTSTATTLADQQMELFRGITYAQRQVNQTDFIYTNIEQTTAGWQAATTDSTWTADSVWQTKMANAVDWTTSTTTYPARIPRVSSCPNNATDPSGYSCNPSYSKTGPDGRSYRIDTYMYYDSVPNSSTGTVKVITVVVRNSSDLSHWLARQTSTFDVLAGT